MDLPATLLERTNAQRINQLCKQFVIWMLVGRWGCLPVSVSIVRHSVLLVLDPSGRQRCDDRLLRQPQKLWLRLGIDAKKAGHRADGFRARSHLPLALSIIVSSRFVSYMMYRIRSHSAAPCLPCQHAGLGRGDGASGTGQQRRTGNGIPVLDRVVATSTCYYLKVPRT